ncbi:hypothetical protein [Methylobacterium sp. CM6247]
MSVDLVGSTAFKAKHANRRHEGAPYADWLHITRKFYRDFPDEVEKAYDGLLPQHAKCIDLLEGKRPQVWKTIGDEIIFCCRLVCMEHLALCMNSFTAALEKYGRDVNASEPELDVKGSTWIASFPAPNSTIVSAVRASLGEVENVVGDTLGEADEINADLRPGLYDFLGKSIDIGFRISRFAQSDELALSLDLAYLLTLLKQHRLVGFDFIFKGREPLKGAISGTPYPIVTIETEKSVKKKELSSLERSVGKSDFADTITLRNYLHAFMEMHGLEVPILALHADLGQPPDNVYPQCFRDFRTAFESGLTDASLQQQGLAEAEAEDSSGDETGTDPAAMAIVQVFADKKINTVVNKTGKPYFGR